MKNKVLKDAPLTSDAVLGSGGVLSEFIENFAVREEQLTMASAVEAVIQNKSSLLVEAGTGTGKTFAYLAPALLSSKKVIISTGTKNLQDQLFHKDLPVMLRAVPFHPDVALLKGRANYICLYRLDLAFETGRFHNKKTIADLRLVRQFSSRTHTGDISEMDDVADDAAIWPFVTSTTDNCLQQECPLYKRCFLIKARRKAVKADIVVINHHLFFADLALQDSDAGELLPNAEVIIFDEAHQIPDIATHFFEKRFSSRQLFTLTQDVEIESLKVAKDIQKPLEREVMSVQKALQDMRLAFGLDSRRDNWKKIASSPVMKKAVIILKESVTAFSSILQSVSELSEGLESCWRRSTEILALLNLLTEETDHTHIHWFETHAKSFSLHLTPIQVAKQFKEYRDDKKAAFIFTSATLTVNNAFSYFIEALGLEAAETLQLPSPFDYKKQALLYLPRYLPAPNSPHYTKAMLDAMLPVLKASRGRAFVLFTSYQALHIAGEYLANKINFPLLMQGEQSKTVLLQEFMRSGQAVLLGTSSFWEGVDIRGDALSCVIIDKLPFASPGDPVLQARIEDLKKRGLNAFDEYQLPLAVIGLKQGVGRLIRDVSDRGLLVICDPRLVSRDYGRVFMQSLPALPRTRELEKAEAFFGGVSPE